MHNRRKLWSIFGPVILAFVLIVVLFSLPIKNKHSTTMEKQAAVSLSPVVFKNQSIKQQAMSNHQTKFVPFFGSSELRRMDKYHPSVMAARYHNYTPFLFGSRGTQSLPQFFNINSIENQLTDQKAVYIISPQWFTKQGVKTPAFKFYNGTYADLSWLQKANPRSPYDRYTARRLLTLLGTDGTIGAATRKIAAGHALSGWDRLVINIRVAMLKHEDALFSEFQINENYQKHILPNVNKLPKKYNYDQLYKDAEATGERDTTNNRFRVKNSFYTKKIKPHEKWLAGSQRHLNYTQSPEYGDLQVVLNQFKNTNTNVLFVIPPVNAKWEKFTGLDMQMYYRSVNKIKFQLREQGFNNVLDLSHDGGKTSFMEDTIHIGWAGWVKFDRASNSFITSKQPAPHYRLSDQFLTQRWANLNPTPANLEHFKEQLK